MCSGSQGKESVWMTGRIAKGIESPCDAVAKAATLVCAIAGASPSHLVHLPARAWHAMQRVFSPRERQEDEKQSDVVRSCTNPLRWLNRRSPRMRRKGEVDIGLKRR